MFLEDWNKAGDSPDLKNAFITTDSELVAAFADGEGYKIEVTKLQTVPKHDWAPQFHITEGIFYN